MSVVVMGAAPAIGQEPLDGPHRIFQDELLDNLVGNWKPTGEMMGRPFEQDCRAGWLLNHQLLRLHDKDAQVSAAGKPPYEAMMLIGRDNTSERYVVHLLDIFGGRASEPLGSSTRSKNSIQFRFEYPDGPFHNTFTGNPDTKTWNSLLEQKDKTGKCAVFADKRLRRSE